MLRHRLWRFQPISPCYLEQAVAAPSIVVHTHVAGGGPRSLTTAGLASRHPWWPWLLCIALEGPVHQPSVPAGLCTRFQRASATAASPRLPRGVRAARGARCAPCSCKQVTRLLAWPAACPSARASWLLPPGRGGCNRLQSTDDLFKQPLEKGSRAINELVYTRIHMVAWPTESPAERSDTENRSCWHAAAPARLRLQRSLTRTLADASQRSPLHRDATQPFKLQELGNWLWCNGVRVWEVVMVGTASGLSKGSVGGSLARCGDMWG